MDTKVKLTNVTSGPYIVHRVVRNNTYQLKDEQGHKLKFLVNGRRLSHIIPRTKGVVRQTPADEVVYADLPKYFIKREEGRLESSSQVKNVPKIREAELKRLKYEARRHKVTTSRRTSRKPDRLTVK